MKHMQPKLKIALDVSIPKNKIANFILDFLLFWDGVSILAIVTEMFCSISHYKINDED